MGILFDLALVLLVLGFAVYQVVATRRLLREREEREAREGRDAADDDRGE